MKDANPLLAAWERVRDAAADRVAVEEVQTGRRWRFAELDAAAGALTAGEGEEWRLPGGFSVAIIWETLRAWRDGVALCPLERPDRDRTLLPHGAELPVGTCHVKLTSGSTGGPRLVAFSADALAADARKIVATMGLRPEWPNLGVISMAHSYGFSNLVLPLLLHGIPLVWLGDPLPGAVANRLGKLPEGGEGWTLPAVPAMWRVWHESGILGGAPIRRAISAGAPLPVELERAIHATSGLKVHNFYGSSECGGIAYDRSDEPRVSADFAGKAMAETDLAVDEDGCLTVCGPSVALGYVPDDGTDRLARGMFRTSDLARLEAGAVWLTGRSDDVINVAGRKVSPAGVERALTNLPGLTQVLVFGIASADPVRGEEIVAVLNVPGSETDGEVIERARWLAGQALPTHERPRHWWRSADLAPDARGKLSRHRWRRLFQERCATG